MDFDPRDYDSRDDERFEVTRPVTSLMIGMMTGGNQRPRATATTMSGRWDAVPARTREFSVERDPRDRDVDARWLERDAGSATSTHAMCSAAPSTSREGWIARLSGTATARHLARLGDANARRLSARFEWSPVVISGITTIVRRSALGRSAASPRARAG